MEDQSTVLLVGAGHTHLHVITRAAKLRRAGLQVTLIAPATFHYSGLATAVATGTMPSEAATIDVRRLAARFGVHHLEGQAIGCDPGRREVTLEDGRRVRYDVVSFNIGSVAATGNLDVAAGVATVKPFDQLFTFSRWIAATDPRRRVRVSVVGGGPTGLELAGQLAARLGSRAAVTLFERGQQPGGGLPAGARRRAVRVLERRGVVLRTRSDVQGAYPDHLVVDGGRLDHDAIVLAIGLTATPFPTLGDARGIPVRDTLQHVDHDEVYAVGDCADFTPQPLPKLGVYGVRQGPVLERSLLARQAGRPLPTYRPQRRALQILDLGGGTALATRGRWWAENPTMQRLKLRIDHRWLGRYR